VFEEKRVIGKRAPQFNGLPMICHRGEEEGRRSRKEYENGNGSFNYRAVAAWRGRGGRAL